MYNSSSKKPNMTEEAYLKDRLDDQLAWYDKKSQYNQKRFKLLSVVEIIAAAFIPFLSGMEGEYLHLLIGGLGVFIAVAAAVIALFKYQENWIQYRTTAEQLKHEKYIYLTDTKPYDTEDKFHLLVERVESLISKENSTWATLAHKKTNVQKKP